MRFGSIYISRTYIVGSLLGTGPLIDPGFVGKLVIPLHNLTDKDWCFRGGEGLIWIEFTKLSRNSRWKEREEDEHRCGVYKEFPGGKRELQFLQYLEKAAETKPVPPIRASVGEFLARLDESENIAKSAKEKAEETKQSVEARFRRIQLVGVLAILVAAVLGLPPILSLIQQSTAYVIAARKEFQAVDHDRKEQLRVTQEQLEATSKELQDVRGRVEQLEHACHALPVQPKAAGSKR